MGGKILNGIKIARFICLKVYINGNIDNKFRM